MRSPDSEYFSKLHKEFKIIMKEIAKAERIIIFRHEVPDFDALGTQMGLYTFIKDNYPSKEVHYVGDVLNAFIPRIFPYPEEVSEEMFAKPYLAIIVDTADTKRVSKLNLTNAYKVIKMDHHPEVEKFAHISCVHPEMAAAGELVALMLESMSKSYQYISPEAARYFYIAIVGDSGRFRFPEVSPMTLRIAADLLQCGINKEKIYSEMYFTRRDEFEFKKWVLTNYKISEGGTCYYVLTDKDLKTLNIEAGEGKTQISLFRDVEGIEAIASITEDVSKGEWRVSLRSSTKPVSQVAQMFRGGGHLFAAGAKLASLDELPSLISELDKLHKVENIG